MAQRPTIWYRKFVRSNGPDVDIEATDEFMGDHFTDGFGKSLFQEGRGQIYVSSLLTQDKLIKYYYGLEGYSVQPFLVVDGVDIGYTNKNESWFNSQLRFLYVITKGSEFQGFTAFVVASRNLQSENAFLQVVGWDRRSKEFLFYAREPANGGQIGWIYQGKSSDAFGDKSYLGPFMGHVNGVVVMKELHSPWVHWKNSALEKIYNCITTDEKKTYGGAPYLSTENRILGHVKRAETLEKIVSDGASLWFSRRIENDFKLTAINVDRWMAHLLLTTTVNIAAASKARDSYLLPRDHFVNIETLGKIDMLPDLPNLRLNMTHYSAVVEKVGLSLVQEVSQDSPHLVPVLPEGTLGGGKGGSYDQTRFIKALDGEGEHPFICLQSSLEDAIGISCLFSQKGKRLLSEAAIVGLLAVDFYNPIYSWRRGVLIRYVPKAANYNSYAEEYDLESTFVSSIQESPNANVDSTPEHEFLQFYKMLQEDLNQGKKTIKGRISNYMAIIDKNLRCKAYLEKYSMLAESRRRIYRPLPLNEFGYSLPYALKIPPNAVWLEMQENGEVGRIPERGLNFLLRWRDSLYSDDPSIIPQALTTDISEASAVANIAVEVPRSGRCPIAIRSRAVRPDDV